MECESTQHEEIITNVTSYINNIFNNNLYNIYASLQLRVQNRRRKTKSATQFQHV